MAQDSISSIDQKRAFIEKNLMEIVSDEGDGSEGRFRKEVGDWMAAFRTCHFHKTVITEYCDEMEVMILAGSPIEIKGRIPTTMALAYFLLGRRAGMEEKSHG